MSDENMELVRRSIRSLEVFWSLLDENVVWDLPEPRAVDFDSTYAGRDAVIAASRRYWGTWGEYGLEAEKLIDTGPSVVAVLRERGRGRTSGAPFEQQVAQVWTFQQGRIVRWQCFADEATALKAAGLSA
jgi:ketosteroid isomerase-like protein